MTKALKLKTVQSTSTTSTKGTTTTVDFVYLIMPFVQYILYAYASFEHHLSGEIKACVLVWILNIDPYVQEFFYPLGHLHS